MNFTPREIDIIACLLSGAPYKTITHILSINEKTIETHKYNIMRKLECTSKEDLRNFVEKSDQFLIIEQHYLNLLLEADFKKCLQAISGLKNKNSHACMIIYAHKQENKALFVDQFEKYLNLVGIKTYRQALEEGKLFTLYDKEDDSQFIEHIFYVTSENLISGLCAGDKEANQEISLLTKQALERPGSVVFLLQEKEILSDIPYEIPNISYVDFKEPKAYYLSLFELLKKILPQIDLEKTISEFRIQYEIIHNNAESYYSYVKLEKNSPSHKKRSENRVKTFLIRKKKTIFLSAVASLGVISAFLLAFNGDEVKKDNKNQRESTIHYNLSVPTDNSLLMRPYFMAQIEESLKENRSIQTVALVGIGGAGKTTLARQYAQSQKSSVVWEINAETKESLRNSFENLAYALARTEEQKKILKEIEEIKDAQERGEKVFLFATEMLRAYSGWLLLYDNIEKFADIQKYFPYNPDVWGQGKVIVTTRDNNIVSNNYVDKYLYIDELSPQEKLALFVKIMSNGNKNISTSVEKQQAEKFLADLPPFPLDISVAGHYLRMTNVKYEQYLEYLKENNNAFAEIQENVLKEASDYTKSRYSIITLSLKQLLEAHKDFADLLLIISLLDSQNIPKDLLDAYKGSVIVDNFIYHLKKYSLITHEIGSTNLTSNFSIHRSTQEISLTYLTKTLGLRKESPLLQVISSRLESYLDQLIDKEDFSKRKLLVPHYEKFLNYSNLLSSAVKGVIEGKLGYLYYSLGDYNKAKSKLEEGLNNLRTTPLENSSTFAKILVYLAYSYWDLGHYVKAKTVTEQALQKFKIYAPDNKAEIARALGLQGILCAELDDYEKARKLLEESLAIYKKYVPDKYAGIADVLIYLGVANRYLGDYKKAKILFEQGLKLYTKYLPQNYVAIGWAFANLGNVESDLGFYEKAEFNFEKGLRIYQNYLSGHQVEIARFLARLGKLYNELGYYEKAENYFKESLTIYKKYLPQNHVAVAWALAYLSMVNRGLGHLKQAKSLIEESLLIYKQHLADDCIEVARALTFYANIYRDLGDYNNAKSLLQKSFSSYEKVYGIEHINTARILRDLGAVYCAQGETKIAEDLLKKALKIFKQEKHPESYLSLEYLAELYLQKSLQSLNKKDVPQSQEYKTQAIKYLRQALVIVKTHFPEDSLHIVKIQKKLKLLV
ncbi:MAG: hypothetical protein BGO76_06340 [Caedibacter sp. 38-128]|nr:tetratricopeptide repeat protein [Holosporales bacterium]OJX04031.1 MAG: hypothetical protein BGO76_06340 [Caedibacter sp. 38-128]